MELMEKQGYKQTEVGLIPKDWIVLPQKDAVKYINGRAYSITEWETSGVPVVRLQNLTQRGGRFYYSNLNLPEYQYMYKGDLIFMWSASFGPYIWWGDKAIYHYHIWKIECNSKITDKKFYYHKLVQLTEELKKGTSGSTMLHLTKAGMENYLFALPPTLQEQKAIATALSDVDALISQLEALIAKKKAIKQGAMQELLTPKEGWQTKKIKELARYRRGSFPQPYGLAKWYDDISGMPFVQVVDVDDNKKLKPETKQKISAEGAKMSVFVKKGTVILTIQGSIGRICITQYDAYVDRTLLIFESLLEDFNKYFFMLSIWLKFQIEKENAPGGIIKTITKEALSSFEISYPTRVEQDRIATILSDMDVELEQLEIKKAKYQSIKQGMMQELLTGKTRLV